MGKQMWFGNERKFQWVPAPASGISVSNVGYSEEIGFSSGRAGVYRTMQSHKEYDLSFPVQEASGATGLDVFNRYASGMYGDCNDYPIFFADPMHYDQNLLPPGWAAPGLYGSGWASIVADDPRVVYNLATNPSAETATTNYTGTAGTSGVITTALTTSGTQVSGTNSFRVTWTTGTSAVSGGANYLNTVVSPNTRYDFNIYANPSKTQRLQLTVRWRNAAGTSLSTSTLVIVVSAATPTLFSLPNLLSPSTAARVDLEIAAVSGTSGTNWAVSDWLQLDAVMISPTNGTHSTYFDGSHVGAAWNGTAHASTSYLFASKSTVVISDTPTNSYDLPHKQGVWTLNMAANVYPTPDNRFGNIPYALIPIPPGYTLHVGASGSATGTAQLVVAGFFAPGDPAAPAFTTALTLLSTTGSTRLNASWTSAQANYVKIYVRRTSTAASTITLASIMAQLWPTGVSPTLTGNHIAGQGHRGLKFADNASVESYVMVDLTRNVPVHYKGMATRLVEAQDRG